MSTKEKVSFTINALIVVFVAFCLVCDIIDFEFMGHIDTPVVTDSTGLHCFKFFTIQSNVFVGLSALFFVIYYISLARGNTLLLPRWIFVFKLAATVGVMITFTTVVCFLAPMSGTADVNGWTLIYANTNLFLHTVVPLLAFVSFAFFENRLDIKEKHIYWGLVHIVLYSIFYVTNISLHIEDGHVSLYYDFYGFGQAGVLGAMIVFVIVLLVAYVFSFVLWKLNKKFYTNSFKAQK